MILQLHHVGDGCLPWVDGVVHVLQSNNSHGTVTCTAQFKIGH